MIKKSNIAIILVIYLILSILKLKHLTLPYYWDDIYPYIPASIYSATHNLSLALYGLDASHPPFFFLITALAFFIFGITPVVAHIVIILFSGLAIFLSYQIGRYLFNKSIGLVSSLFLLSSPLFLAQSSISQITIIELTLFVMSFYFFVSKRYIWFSIICSLLLLTKEIFIFVPFLAFFSLVFIKKEKITLKRSITLFSPLIVFFFWTLTNRFIYGWFLAPYGSAVIHPSLLFIFPNLIFISKYLFFDDFRWLLTSIMILGPIISSENFKNHISPKKIFKSILLFLIVFGTLHVFSIGFNKILPLHFDNFNIYLDSLLIVMVIFHWKELIKFWVNKKQSTFFIFIIFTTLIFSIFPWLPRYTLFIMPLYFLMAGYVLYETFKNKYILTLIVILFISISIISLNGKRDDVGFWLENNYEFLDYIKVRQEAATYLMQNHEGKSILARYPEFFDLSYPWVGYVQKEKSFNLQGIDYYTFYELNNSLFNKPFGTSFNDRKISRAVNSRNDYEILYVNESSIDFEDLDLIYYSPQSYGLLYNDMEQLKEEKKLNLKLLKRFSSNNKYVEIYKVERNQNN